MKNTKLLIVLLSVLLCYGVWHEIVSIKVSSDGYYSGTVIDKTVSVGRSSTYYLYVEWDGIGRDNITTHPVTYKRTSIGSKISTQYEYVPIFGAIGATYAPSNNEYSFAFAITGFFAKISAVFVAAIIWRRRKLGLAT